MTGVILWALLVGSAPQLVAAVDSKPLVSPLFMSRDVDRGPAFFVECRNTTGSTVSSGSELWAFTRSSVRVDGASLDEPLGGLTGPGAHDGRSPSGCVARHYRASPVTRIERERERCVGCTRESAPPCSAGRGRHTIAVRCNGVWSDDIVFYWESGPTVW